MRAKSGKETGESLADEETIQLAEGKETGDSVVDEETGVSASGGETVEPAAGSVDQKLLSLTLTEKHGKGLSPPTPTERHRRKGLLSPTPTERHRGKQLASSTAQNSAASSARLGLAAPPTSESSAVLLASEGSAAPHLQKFPPLPWLCLRRFGWREGLEFGGSRPVLPSAPLVGGTRKIRGLPSP